MIESEHDPWAALAMAVVFQAAQDVQSENPACVSEARTWLQFVGLGWCQVLDVPDFVLTQWAMRGFELPDVPHRNWRYWG
jgi:hypothetical protein